MTEQTPPQMPPVPAELPAQAASLAPPEPSDLPAPTAPLASPEPSEVPAPTASAAQPVPVELPAQAAPLAPPELPALTAPTELPALPALVPAPAKPPRRALRAVARWTAVLLVLGGVGAGTAFGITGMERTDVPGLATKSDGRWDYPKLALPALPAGSPRPFTDGNEAEIHHADLRKLLLPAPRGAAVDKKLTGGWVSTDQYLSEYAEDERAGLRQALTDYSVRHIAARGWSMPDGTTTRIYLLRFNSVAFAESFMYSKLNVGMTVGAPLTGAPTTELDETYEASGAVDTSDHAYVEPKPYGAQQVRQSYVVAGDTLALVVHAKKGGAAAVPFHQTLILQNQLLG